VKNAELIQIVNDLKKVTLDCFSEASCNWSNQGIFGTHFDWHSSVHAHWMLLSSSRIFSDKVVVSKTISRFDRTSFEYERQLLLKDPNFELPYGQSWLLLLLSELEKHDILFTELKNETIIRVIGWLNQTEFPQKSADSYHSWLISYFLLRKSGFQYPKELDIKFNLVDFVRDEDDPNDFFSSESLFSLLKGSPKSKFEFDLKSFPKPVTIQNCHVVGKLISKSWITPEVNKDACQNSIEFTQAYLKESYLWKSDFGSLGHWIPQFLWVGLWLSLGES
jgi:hypothetical protein